MTVSPSLYHVAHVVPDLGEAMDKLGGALDLKWAKPQRRSLRVWTPGGIVSSELEVTYSIQGPPYWELFQLQAGPGPWSVAGPHHVGIWTDELEDQLRRLEEAGFAQEFAGVNDADEMQGFRYVKDAVGNRIEVLHRPTAQPMLDNWLAGGDYA